MTVVSLLVQIRVAPLKTQINMALFIKTLTRCGGKGLLNMQNVEHIHTSRGNGVCYTPVRGVDQHASFSPSVAHCSDSIAEIILDEIIDFMAVNTDGVFDAYSRVQELEQKRIDELDKKWCS